jgi:hypothetical protein
MDSPTTPLAYTFVSRRLSFFPWILGRLFCLLASDISFVLAIRPFTFIPGLFSSAIPAHSQD